MCGQGHRDCAALSLSGREFECKRLPVSADLTFALERIQEWVSKAARLGGNDVDIDRRIEVGRAASRATGGRATGDSDE